MIQSIRHRGLKRLWTRNDASGIRPDWLAKVQLILDRLDAITAPVQMDLPGLKFHELTADRKGTFSVLVSHNWRITWTWDGLDACHVDLEDYHGR